MIVRLALLIKKKLDTRIRKHILIIKKKLILHLSYYHRINLNHNSRWNEVKILDSESSYNKRLISEMIHKNRV